MFLKTPVSSSKDFKTFSAVSGKEAVPRALLPETSNASVKRPLLVSNRSVSSPHSDSDTRLVNLYKKDSYLSRIIFVMKVMVLGIDPSSGHSCQSLYVTSGTIGSTVLIKDT